MDNVRKDAVKLIEQRNPFAFDDKFKQVLNCKFQLSYVMSVTFTKFVVDYCRFQRLQVNNILRMVVSAESRCV